MIQLLSKRRGQDLLRVTLAHRRNRVSKQNAAPHNIDYVSQLNDLRIEKAPCGHASYFKDTPAKDTLVGEIMNGIYRSRPRKERIVVIDCMHPVGHNARLPIVAVNYVRCPAKRAYRLKRGETEEDEAFAIVGVAINILALKIARCLNEIHGNILTNSALPRPPVPGTSPSSQKRLRALAANRNVRASPEHN